MDTDDADIINRIIAMQADRAKDKSNPPSAMLQYFLDAAKSTDNYKRPLTRNDIVKVKQFDWRADQFLRLKNDFYLDDVIVNSVATLFVEQTNGTDAVLDSILNEAQPRKLIDVTRYRFIYAPIYNRANLHFQLVVLDPANNKYYFIDPNPKSGRVTAKFKRELHTQLASTIPELQQFNIMCEAPVEQQRNSFDCGLLVLSYIKEMCNTGSIGNFTTRLSRNEVFEFVLTHITEECNLKVMLTCNNFTSANSKLILGITNENELRALQLSDECMQQYVARLKNITTKSAPSEIATDLCKTIAFYHNLMYSYSQCFV